VLRRSRLLGASALSVVGLFAAAPANGAPAASLTTPSHISAGAGWLVWSVKDGDGHRLAARHAGRTRVLAVEPAPEPFSADVGTDARGRAVAVFRRCSDAAPTDVVDTTPPDCRLRVVDLVTGVERSAGIGTPAGASDTAGSMWRGRLVFARASASSGVRILLTRPGTQALTALPSGPLQSPCVRRDPRPSGCRNTPATSQVVSLDMGARVVAIRRTLVGTGVTGNVGYEIRAVRLADRRTHLLGTGWVGEYCASETEDSSVPSAPAVSGETVWFVQMSLLCASIRSTIVRATVERRVRLATGRLTGRYTEVAIDGSVLFALRQPPSRQDEPACRAAEPCSVTRLVPPRLRLIATAPRAPFWP
jgi:hypothetical protein